ALPPQSRPAQGGTPGHRRDPIPPLGRHARSAFALRYRRGAPVVGASRGWRAVAGHRSGGTAFSQRWRGGGLTMWFLFALALVSGGALWLRSQAGRPGNPVNQAWINALAPYGSPVEGKFYDLARISTREGGLQIRVEAAQDGPDLVTVLFPGLAGVEIQKVAEGLQWARQPEGGDANFESMFRVSGSDRLTSALLDAETRRLMMSLGSDRLEISNGQVRAEMTVEQAPRLLPPLLDLAKRLARPLDVEQRLAENALTDPIAALRLRNLVLLQRESPEAPQTVATLRAACADRNARIRLRAARELGAEGYSVLAELTGSMQDEVSEEAVLLLGRNLPLPRLRETLAQALHHRHVRTARACLKAFSHSDGADAADIGMLANVMAVHEGELAVAAARALWALASPAAETALILALQREQEDLQVAAADALGRLGSAAAVL